jgi:hypothetical protein
MEHCDSLRKLQSLMAEGVEESAMWRDEMPRRSLAQVGSVNMHWKIACSFVCWYQRGGYEELCWGTCLHGHIRWSLAEGQKRSEYVVLKQCLVASRKIDDDMSLLLEDAVAMIAGGGELPSGFVHATWDG